MRCCDERCPVLTADDDPISYLLDRLDLESAPAAFYRRCSKQRNDAVDRVLSHDHAVPAPEDQFIPRYYFTARLRQNDQQLHDARFERGAVLSAYKLTRGGGHYRGPEPKFHFGRQVHLDRTARLNVHTTPLSPELHHSS